MRADDGFESKADDEFRLKPWSEIIGRIESIDDNLLTLSCSKMLRFRVPREAVASLGRKLCKGSEVSILVLDNGDVKVKVVRKGRS